jgi:PAS domain S-box-containing protein
MDAPERAPAQTLMPDESTEMLRQRLRTALLLCLPAIAMFAVFDLYLVAPGQLPYYYGLKLGALAVALTAAQFLRRPRGRGAVIAVGLTCIAAMYALSTASAVAAREPVTTQILNVAVALGTATLLPWGAAPQVVVALIAALAAVVTAYGATGSLASLLQYPTVGAAVAIGLSVHVAAEFDRSRRALAQRRADQQRAEAEVRQLNDVLEGRVAQRTAELEQLFRELQRSEAALSALIENADDAIWSIDRSARLTAFNAATAQRYKALGGGALRLGMSFDDMIPDPYRPQWRALYDRGLAGERFSVEQAIDMPDGVRHYVICFNPIVPTDTVTGLAIFSTDVTERKRAEEAARNHQAELTHVLRVTSMGEMAAGLAHEINQPLSAIANYAQGSVRRLRANPADVGPVLAVIDDIAAEALRAGEIIRRLRSLIRKEAPRQDWVDVNEVVGEVVRLLEPETRQHGVTVRVYADVQLPTVVVDRIQIEQVILNLVRNAVDAMLEVSGRRELVIRTAAAGGDWVELSVRDTGPGLTAGVLERLFDPFFSTKPAGLGMGLSISRTIIEAHHGRLWVTSPAGGGADFHFTLPVPPRVALASAAM